MPNTFFTRTIGTPTSTKIFTLSVWFKRTSLNEGRLISSWNGVNSQFWTMITSDKLFLGDYDGSYNVDIQTDRLFRDMSAWYHVVFSCDSTQATSSNRIKIYVNGVQETSFSSATYPSQNLDFNFTNSGDSCRIGVRDAGEYFDGLMAHLYYIDGQALTPSSFGETDATTGIWKPKTYSGSYGANGFFLKFENSASLGTDSSGNGNNFTVNGTPTQTVDTPSNNFATGNPLYRASNNNTFTNGNLTFTGSGEAYPVNIATFQPTAGKWYWETKIITKTTNPIIGMAWNGYTSGGTGRVAYRADGAIITHDGNELSGYSSFTNNDIIGCALDLNSGTTTLKFYKNNTLIYTYNNIATVLEYSTRGEGMIFFQLYTSDVISANFGNGRFGTTAITSPNSDGAGLGKFQYAVPSGYYALCTKNINVYG